jgi:hypothetical protein
VLVYSLFDILEAILCISSTAGSVLLRLRLGVSGASICAAGNGKCSTLGVESRLQLDSSQVVIRRQNSLYLTDKLSKLSLFGHLF